MDRTAGTQPLVILVHGLGRSPLSLLPLEAALRREGFATASMRYVAWQRSFRMVADRVSARIDGAIAAHTQASAVYFVTHSLGGLLVRAWMASRTAPPVAGVPVRCVQIAPPNSGAAFAERLSRHVLPSVIAGEILADLGVAGDGPRHALPEQPPDWAEVGVIAGGHVPRVRFPWFSADSDGVVQVAETWLSGAKDWIMVPRLHTFIGSMPEVRAHAIAFLTSGRFGAAPRLERDAVTGDVRVLPAHG